MSSTGVRRPILSTGVRRPQAWLIAIGAATVVALVLRLWGISHQSFWYDESLTVDEMHMRFTRMLTEVRLHEVTPPLYFASAWFWTKLFGTSEAGLRSLSVIAGVLTVPAAAACAATLAGRRAAVITAALVAVHPLLIWYSQEARSYALLTLLCTLSWLFFLRAARDGGSRDLALWAVASALALATHYFALFLVAPELAWLVARGLRRRPVWFAALGVVAVGLVLLPFAIARRSSGTGWIHGIALDLRLRQIAEQFAAGFGRTPAILVASAALVALAVAALLAGGERPMRRAAAMALATAGAALLPALALVGLGLDYLITRNVIFAVVPLVVFVAIGLAALRARWAAAAAAVALAALGVAATVRVDTSAALQRPDWRVVAHALGPDLHARAIVVAGSYRGRPVKTYLPHTGFMTQPAPAVREIDVIGMRGPREAGCWWGAECNLPDATPDTRPPARGFHLLSRQRAGNFTIARFGSATPVAFDTCSATFRSGARFRGTRAVSVIVLVQRPPQARRRHARHARHGHVRPGHVRPARTPPARGSAHRSRFGCVTANRGPQQIGK
jgi:mannosyltransferase